MIVTDPVDVIQVSVRLLSGAGAVLESGPAFKYHRIWIYRTTATVPATSDCQIEINPHKIAGAEAKATHAARTL